MDCPFCGNDDICVAEDDTHDFCNNCGARGPIRKDDWRGWNDGDEFTWNSRMGELGAYALRSALEHAERTLFRLLMTCPTLPDQTQEGSLKPCLGACQIGCDPCTEPDCPNATRRHLRANESEVAMRLSTRLEHDLDNLCEIDLSVVDTAQTPPQSFKYHTKEGPAWKSPLTGDSLTEAEAWLFDNPAHVSTPDHSVRRANCYICRDPDFARMGLPLCSACRFCGGHVAADDSCCDDCGKEQLPDCTGCGRDHPDCTCGAPGVCNCDYCKAGTDLSHRTTEFQQQ